MDIYSFIANLDELKRMGDIVNYSIQAVTEAQIDLWVVPAKTAKKINYKFKEGTLCIQ